VRVTPIRFSLTAATCRVTASRPQPRAQGAPAPMCLRLGRWRWAALAAPVSGEAPRNAALVPPLTPRQLTHSRSFPSPTLRVQRRSCQGNWENQAPAEVVRRAGGGSHCSTRCARGQWQRPPGPARQATAAGEGGYCCRCRAHGCRYAQGVRGGQPPEPSARACGTRGGSVHGRGTRGRQWATSEIPALECRTIAANTYFQSKFDQFLQLRYGGEVFYELPLAAARVASMGRAGGHPATVWTTRNCPQRARSCRRT